jgi:hypothetical protein
VRSRRQIAYMTYRRAADVITTDLQHELVLLDPRNGEMFALNATARCIWLTLPADLDAVAAALTNRFDAAANQTCSDAASFLALLAAAGLVTCAD